MGPLVEMTARHIGLIGSELNFLPTDDLKPNNRSGELMRYEDGSTWRVSNRAALLNVPCAISDLRRRGIATCRSSPQIKMADFDQETLWNGKRHRHQSNREQSRKSFRPALRWISVRRPGHRPILGRE